MRYLVSIFLSLLLFSQLIFSQFASQNVFYHNTTLLDVQFVNEYVGYISDDVGRIYWTTDRGLNWHNHLLSSDSSFFNSISIIDEQSGWALALDKVIKFKWLQRNNTVLKKEFSTDIGDSLYDIQMLNVNVG